MHASGLQVNELPVTIAICCERPAGARFNQEMHVTLKLAGKINHLFFREDGTRIRDLNHP